MTTGACPESPARQTHKRIAKTTELNSAALLIEEMPQGCHKETSSNPACNPKGT